MIRKWKCWLGRHRWFPIGMIGMNPGEFLLVQKCARCGRENPKNLSTTRAFVSSGNFVVGVATEDIEKGDAITVEGGRVSLTRKP